MKETSTTFYNALKGLHDRNICDLLCDGRVLSRDDIGEPIMNSTHIRLSREFFDRFGRDESLVVVGGGAEGHIPPDNNDVGEEYRLDNLDFTEGRTYTRDDIRQFLIGRGVGGGTTMNDSNDNDDEVEDDGVDLELGEVDATGI